MGARSFLFELQSFRGTFNSERLPLEQLGEKRRAEVDFDTPFFSGGRGKAASRKGGSSRGQGLTARPRCLTGRACYRTALSTHQFNQSCTKEVRTAF